MIDTEKIKRTMARKGITTEMMCKELLLPKYALNMILNKGYPPTWEDLCRIANVIGCNVTDLIVKEGEHEQDRNRAQLKAPEEVS